MSKLGPNLTKDVSLPLFDTLNHFEKTCLNLSIYTIQEIKSSKYFASSPRSSYWVGKKKVSNLKTSSRAAL